MVAVLSKSSAGSSWLRRKSGVDNSVVRVLGSSGSLVKYFSENGARFDTLVEPAIDVASMSARVRISTDIVDREKMIIRQEGIKLDYYLLNPTVLYGHGEEGVCYPVAKSEDEEGNCTVVLCDDGTYARAYHDKNNQLSCQVFDMVVSKMLRAASIGVTPTKASFIYDSSREKIPVIDECYLNEWSWCAIGVNPEAIVKSMTGARRKHADLWVEAYSLQSDAVNRFLVRNRLDGTVIHPALKKSLLRLAPRAKGSGVGFGFHSKEQDMGTVVKSMSVSEIKKLKGVGLLKSLMAMDSYDEGTQKEIVKAAESFLGSESCNKSADGAALGPDEDMEITKGFGDGTEDESADSMVQSDGENEDNWGDDTSSAEGDAAPAAEETEEPTEDTEVEEDPSEEPDTSGRKLGAVVLSAMHEGLKDLIAKTEKAMAPVEETTVLDQLGTLIDGLKDSIAAVEGVYSKKYPNEPALSGGEDEEVDVTDDLMKSFLASKRTRPVQLVGLAARLDAVVKKTSSVIPGPQKKALMNTISDLTRMAKEAKSFHRHSEEVRTLSTIEQLEKRLSAALEERGDTPAQL